MKVRFEVGTSSENSLLTENEFIAKIDKSIREAESGKIKKLMQNEQKQFLGIGVIQ